MATAKIVGQRLTKLGRTIPEILNVAIQGLVVRIDAQIVLANPVDTGRSRANWLVGINNEISNTKPISENEGVSGSEQFSADIALSQAQSAIKGRKPEDTVFLVNNTDYIEQLNDGSSAQAPANFVQTAIMQGIQSFKNQRIVDTAAKRI